MTPAPMPADEDERLAALRELLLLDTPPEERFDRLARFAAEQLDTPIALLTLVDGQRQWFKSRMGLEATETPREEAYEGVVLDLQEGPQALELLSELRQGRFATPRDTRAVVLAGGGSQVDTERLQGLGVARVLGKPVRISELLDAVAGVQEDGAPAA